MIKVVFHIINFLLIIFYVYPGSILGYLMYNDISNQPNVIKLDIFSFNNFIVFFIFSIISIKSFKTKKKKIILYLFSLSFILEITHYFIKSRAFELSDLFGNILGIISCLLILKIFKVRRK